jgi:hypothetical protein
MNALIVLMMMLPAQVDDAAAEGSPVEELVIRITREMDAVNEALRKAADADAVSNELDAARNSHLSVIRDIEELIQQVKYQRNNNPQSGGGEPKPNQQGQGGEQQPEPRESDGSNAPEPEKDQPGDRPEQQASPDSDVQNDNAQPEDSRGEQEDASRPPRPDEIEPFTAQDTDARWGLLPPKMQERLLNLQVDDVPERYRTWLEAYIRALNRREQEGGGR